MHPNIAGSHGAHDEGMSYAPSPSLDKNKNLLNRALLRIGEYKLGETLGVGSFGKVKLAEHELTGHKVAVKILNRKKIKSLRMDEKIRREIQILKLFRHPHIIKLYEVIETPTDIFMIMEYVPGGELFEYILTHGRLSEDTARRFFQQIIAGVEYCHRNRVVHRDLKPENLLLDAQGQNVKIADFGLSNIMKDGDFLKTSCGSPNYAAPEVISGQLYAGAEVDVWSCGVILYALLCARLPFDDDYIPNLFKKIKSGIYAPPTHVSQSCAQLIAAMLVVDPLKRITIPELRQHEWFCRSLPKYLASPPAEISTKAITNVRESVLQELCRKLQIMDREKVISELTRPQEIDSDGGTEVNRFIVAYHLIEDHKRDYNSEEFVSVAVAKHNGGSAGSSAAQSTNTSPQRPLSNTNTAQPAASTAASGVHTGWTLGIASIESASEIMKSIFRALRTAGFSWKVLGPYSVRVKNGETNTRPIKLGLQLYRVKEHRYLVDLKYLEGEVYVFFDEAMKLLVELKQVGVTASSGTPSTSSTNNQPH